jgi:hypothetical protein
MAARALKFSCPDGCGGILKVRGPSNTGRYGCPVCGKSFTMDRLKPYKLHRSKRPTDTSIQMFFTFKPGKKGKAREDAEIYLEKWDKDQYEKQKLMSGRIWRRQ